MKRKLECHGYYYHPLYKVWISMIQRITNENHKFYKNYGGRGIIICEEWDQSAKVFIEWALSNGWKKGLHFDREDNDGNYEPGNCRFVTRYESNLNRRLIRSDNTSGYKGVSYHKLSRKWGSSIRINSKSKWLGSFDSPRLAALRYDAEVYRLNDGRRRNFF